MNAALPPSAPVAAVALVALTAIAMLGAGPAALAAPAATHVAIASPTMPAAGPAAPTPTATAAVPVAPLGCLIEASAVAEVGSSAIGVLDSVSVDRGSLVRKGQVLAQLESQVERAAVTLALTKVEGQADIQAARTQKDYAQKKAERMVRLTEENFMAPQARDQAETEAAIAGTRLSQALEQRSMADKELALARAQLAQRTISSPLSGVVVERYASTGERIENRPLLKIAQIDPLRVEVVLPSSQFGKVRTGQIVQVQPELDGLKAQSARVTVVDRVIDAASNTFRVRLALPNPSLSVPSGVRCKVAFADTKAPGSGRP